MPLGLFLCAFLRESWRTAFGCPVSGFEPRCFHNSGEGSKALLAGLARCRNLKDPRLETTCARSLREGPFWLHPGTSSHGKPRPRLRGPGLGATTQELVMDWCWTVPAEAWAELRPASRLVGGRGDAGRRRRGGGERSREREVVFCRAFSQWGKVFRFLLQWRAAFGSGPLRAAGGL